MTNHPTVYEVTCLFPKKALIFFEEALADIASATLDCVIETGPDKGKIAFQAIFETDPGQDVLTDKLMSAAKAADIPVPAWVFRPMPDKNWLKESYQSFPPVEIGRYYIYGSHVQTPPPADKVGLCIDAATAFGTGEHQTTCGCLTALDALDIKPRRVLDVGCGSGILAMAYAKTYGEPADAVDIDAESVSVARQNVVRNGLEHLVRVWQSDGYRDVVGKYDLILSNILARPLKEMAPDLAAHLNQEGCAIISGFLTRQEHWVLKSYTELGFYAATRYRIKGWSTLVLKRK